MSPRSAHAGSTRARFRPVDIERFPACTRTDLSLPVYYDAMGNPIQLPLILLRGRRLHPVLGLCAAVHGDELNGIKIIHRILENLDVSRLEGSILCAPIVNVPAFKAGMRRFPEDGKDLNHVFPGKTSGLPSEQYARAIFEIFLKPLHYLIDFHTASESRRNTFYVRADLTSPAARDLAHLMAPEIILHGRSGDGTLRSAARRRDVPAITVEAGDPDVFQARMASNGEWGVLNILHELEMIADPPRPIDSMLEPVVCHSSKWLRTRIGGLLETRFDLGQFVEKGQLMAEIRDPFGYSLGSYSSPSHGIVIGKARSPVAVSGTRYCHLGFTGADPVGKVPEGRISRRLEVLVQEEREGGVRTRPGPDIEGDPGPDDGGGGSL